MTVSRSNRRRPPRRPEAVTDPMNLQPAQPAGAQMAGFAALLRDHGLQVGPAEQVAMRQAMAAVGPLNERHVRAAWRAIACNNLRDWRQWDDLFDRYWHPHKTRGTVKVSGQTKPRRDLRQAVEGLRSDATSNQSKPGAPAAQSAGDQATRSDAPVSESDLSQGGATRAEALVQRDGQMWLPSELTALRDTATSIMANLRPTPTRRWRADVGGHRLNLRQTMRKSIAFGGEPLTPVWMRRREREPQVFILVDVSRSMESHAAFYLRVARAFAQVAPVRAFVFHTRIIEITSLLQRDSAAVQEKINAVTAGFGAGTRIAESLLAFSRQHARAQLSSRSRVWVFSDGFDTEPPERLAEALAAVRARGARVSWFHPTHQAAFSNAMQQAKKQLDRTLPLANLHDLIQAKRVLR